MQAGDRNSATEKTLDVENYWIHDLINQKGLEIKATRFATDDIPAWAYSSINCSISRKLKPVPCPSIATGSNSQR